MQIDNSGSRDRFGDREIDTEKFELERSLSSHDHCVLRITRHELTADKHTHLVNIFGEVNVVRAKDLEYDPDNPTKEIIAAIDSLEQNGLKVVAVELIAPAEITNFVITSNLLERRGIKAIRPEFERDADNSIRVESFDLKTGRDLFRCVGYTELRRGETTGMEELPEATFDLPKEALERDFSNGVVIRISHHQLQERAREELERLFGTDLSIREHGNLQFGEDPVGSIMEVVNAYRSEGSQVVAIEVVAPYSVMQALVRSSELRQEGIRLLKPEFAKDATGQYQLDEEHDDVPLRDRFSFSRYVELTTDPSE